MENEYPLNPATYQWSVRLFSRVKKLVGVNIRVHEHETPLADGDIFLFNHFARFETFIPQYFIHEQTGAYCRSIASSEFFKGDDTLTSTLIKLGAVPNNHPDLLPFLAREILRGRKVVLFPEGGMVKDRAVMDEKGRFSIYSRSAERYRKHHTGAALLALALERFKTWIRQAADRDDQNQLEEWRDTLGLSGVDELLKAVRKPTLIIPSNITFYPIHVNDNILMKSIEIFNKKKLSKRASEELLIESNLILKNTDMDIRLGKGINPMEEMSWWEKSLIESLHKSTNRLEEYFHHAHIKNPITPKLVAKIERYTVGRLRDTYMRSMYSRTTINLSHLASVLIYELIGQEITSIEDKEFFKILYLCIKNIQKTDKAFLHRGLLDSTNYEKVLEGKSEGILKFLDTSISTGLISRKWSRFVFTDKLCDKLELDQIRLGNIIAVYANEAKPIVEVSSAVKAAISQAEHINEQEWASLRFDDEMVRYRWYKNYYRKPRFKKISDLQTATISGEPYMIIPEKETGFSKIGVVLVHGLLSSPAELRIFSERLANKGLPVIGARLPGHSTSPWDLKQREWIEWVESVYRNYEIISAYCDQVCLVGFSTGAAASLLFAADHPPKLAGIAAVSTPIKFSDRNIVFVPFLHGLSKLLEMVRTEESLNPFRINNSDHPELNYRHLPIKTIYELRLMVDILKGRLPEIHHPCMIIQSKYDNVVDASSAEYIEKQIGSSRLSRIMVSSDRHGLILEDIGDCQTHIMSFITSLTEVEPSLQDNAQVGNQGYTEKRVTGDIR